MPAKKTHYEILGLPRTATKDQIKRRYRQLVRKYHPDVAQDKEAAKAAFIQITEAYNTLINDDRRVIYDASLDAEMFRVELKRPEPPPSSQAARSSATTSAGSRGHSAQSPGTRASQAQKWVREAQDYFIRGQFRQAIWACREAQKLDPRNVQCHVILGDIFRIQGQIENAIAMYSIVVQLDPRNVDVQTKLNRLVRQSSSSVERSASGERRAALRMGLNLMGVSMSLFLLFLLAMNPGQPIQWLAMNMPIVGTWSTMLFAVLMINGALVGFLLSVNETVHPLDDELVFQAVRAPGVRPASYPIGLILVLFNFLNFYLAAGVYLIIGLVQESVSKSVMRAFVATFGLILLTALVYAPGVSQVLLWGGNVAFPALLFGWAVGDMFRPGW